MTVSIETTSKKYRGKKAATYEAIRKKQERWDLENKYVEHILADLNPRSVLDVPVGSGRFFQTYRMFGRNRLATVTGVDSSEDMLKLARKKLKSHRVPPSFVLEQGDARDLSKYSKADVAVCVRFLDLIDEQPMREVVAQLCDKADDVIFTIRFGPKYVPKSNTAEHDEKKFWRWVQQLGFVREQEYPIFKQGWRVCHIRRAR